MIRSIAVSLVFLFASLAHAENWPTWRGPTGDGICTEKMLTLVWGEDKNILWRVPMPGRGGATPVVWGDRIFVTSGEGESQVLLCIGTDGKQRWKQVVGTGGRMIIKGDEANEASASPTTDGTHVWAFVGSGHVGCYTVDGKEVWNVDIQKRYGKFKIQHGLHTTPVVHGDHVFLSLLHSNGHWVVALNKLTGEEVWKVARKSDAQDESKEAYASPCLWNDGKETQLVVLGADYATGHRLKDGTELWRLADLNPKMNYHYAFRIIASPVASKDMVVVPTCRGLLMAAVKPGAAGVIKPGSAHEAWRRPKGSPDVPSPLIHNGVVYLNRDGVLECLDAATGKETHVERLHVGRYRASPVYVDGRVILTARDGTFTIVNAGPKAQKIATNVLDDAFTASPAISNGRIYLRGFKTLYAVGAK